MLPDLQRQFAQQLTALECDAESGIASNIKTGASGISAGRRLNVYCNHIAVSLRKALAAIYPVVEILVGEEFFAHTARCYLRKWPGSSGNLHDFGRHLAEFLEGFAAAEQLTYLPDVARMEWARHSVFHAADAGIIDLTALATLSESRYKQVFFQLSPALRLLRVAAPVLEIRHFALAQERDRVAPDIDDELRCLLVCRKGLNIQLQYLPAAAEYFLSLCLQGHSLAVSMMMVIEKYPDFVLQHSLRAWFEDAVICGFTVRSKDADSMH